jgi:hypothetical protein
LIKVVILDDDVDDDDGVDDDEVDDGVDGEEDGNVIFKECCKIAMVFFCLHFTSWDNFEIFGLEKKSTGMRGQSVRFDLIHSAKQPQEPCEYERMGWTEY